jgi:hypothetical protein
MKQENLLTSLSVEQALSILAGAQQTVLAAERAARLSGDRMKEITTLSIALDAERLAEEELVRVFTYRQTHHSANVKVSVALAPLAMA